MLPSSVRSNRLIQGLRTSVLSAFFQCVIVIALADLFCDCAIANHQLEPLEGQTEIAPKSSLRVGIKEAIPFAIRADDGSWTGISVELWRRLASELDVPYEFVELPLDEIFMRLPNHEIDVAVAALSITQEREQRVDFSHAYFTTGLGIAVPLKPKDGWTVVVRRLFSHVFVEVVLVIFILLCASGVLVYFLERKANPEQFGHGIVNGIASGFWWAAVTMTTVGYGDKVPQTVGGRALALVWMFSAILIISSFTASVTSTLTVAGLQSNIRNPSDLKGRRVTTVTGSTGEAYLKREGIQHQSRNTAVECLQSVSEGTADAVIYDAAILRYLCLNDFQSRLDVLPVTFEKQDYAIAIPEESKLREPINRALLEILHDEGWQETLHRYLGN